MRHLNTRVLLLSVLSTYFLLVLCLTRSAASKRKLYRLPRLAATWQSNCGLHL